MTTITSDPLVRRYLAELRAATRHLPRRRREELLEEIRAHIEDALPPNASEADIRTTLERLGDPTTIAAEEGARVETMAPRAGALEWFAVVLLLVGGVVLPVVGWFVGVVLLWSSAVWRTRDKILGTLLVPGGLLTPIWYLNHPVTPIEPGLSCETRIHEGPPRSSITVCVQSPLVEWVALAILIFLVVAPVLTAIHLARRARAARSA
jgi:hypothetical protein